ncbi:MAG: carboxymuconolactone decarboxylase family protein [Xanthomonadales bacterium]|nr:carboxymuconolactone decarboxylase family protein [Xanthomonadales bacterium]
MTHSFPDLIERLNRDIRGLRGELPKTMQAFSALARAASEPGALDRRTKELLAIAIGIAVRCEGCIGFHVKAALAAGASREEIMETVGMAIYMGAGPSMLYGAETLQALDELQTEAAQASGA